MDRLTQQAPKMIAAVIEFIYGDLADKPGRVGAPLTDEMEGSGKAVRGAYRIVYSFDDNEVRIERVEHRSDVYRPR